MSNVRDTQFARFAKLLLKELLDDILDEYGFIGGRDNYADLNHDLNICEAIIARRAYDLSFHAIDNSRSNCMEDWDTEQIMPYIPDMAEYPDPEEQNIAQSKCNTFITWHCNVPSYTKVKIEALYRNGWKEENDHA